MIGKMCVAFSKVISLFFVLLECNLWTAQQKLSQSHSIILQLSRIISIGICQLKLDVVTATNVVFVFRYVNTKELWFRVNFGHTFCTPNI